MIVLWCWTSASAETTFTVCCGAGQCQCCNHLFNFNLNSLRNLLFSDSPFKFQDLKAMSFPDQKTLGSLLRFGSQVNSLTSCKLHLILLNNVQIHKVLMSCPSWLLIAFPFHQVGTILDRTIMVQDPFHLIDTRRGRRWFRWSCDHFELSNVD